MKTPSSLLRRRCGREAGEGTGRPEALRAVFRDSGFASDAVKINVEQIFKQMSPGTEVRGDMKSEKTERGEKAVPGGEIVVYQSEDGRIKLIFVLKGKRFG